METDVTLRAQLKRLEVRLGELESQVAELSDDRAIRELLARYGFNADLMRDEAFVDLWTEDGTIIGRRPEANGEIRRLEGKAALRTFITLPLRHHNPEWYGKTLHVHGNNLITYINGEEAIANSYALHFRERRAQGTDFNVDVLNVANVQWKFRKIEGTWYISERRLVKLGEPEFHTNLDATPK